MRTRLQVSGAARDLALSGTVNGRGMIIQTRAVSEADFVFPSEVNFKSRQYGRIVDHWVASIGLDSRRYGVHSMRRTEASKIYK